MLLKDYHFILASSAETAASVLHGDSFFTVPMIGESMRRVTTIDCNAPIFVGRLKIEVGRAGHVLGAAMFTVTFDSSPGGDWSSKLAVLYTGDYNTTPDRHLAAARVQPCKPGSIDLLITESTYACSIREGRRARERTFLRAIHDTIIKGLNDDDNNGKKDQVSNHGDLGGGKVLIPVFSLGRVQELCVLLEGYWRRHAEELGAVPIYFSSALAEKATAIYHKHYPVWLANPHNCACPQEADQLPCNSVKNLFDFEYVKALGKDAVLDVNGPCVLLASPGMLHAGASLEAFKRWCQVSSNLVLLPGYCSGGTVGSMLLNGHRQFTLDQGKPPITVKMDVQSMSFSAHADSKGILQVVEDVGPAAVMLVHGEREKMLQLREKIDTEMGVPCYAPANGEGLILHFPHESINDNKALKERRKALQAKMDLAVPADSTDPHIHLLRQMISDADDGQ